MFKLVEVEKLSEVFSLPVEDRKNKFFMIKSDETRAWFFCPCNMNLKEISYIDLIENHSITSKDPLNIEGSDESSSLSFYHGGGLCHFNINDGKIKWHADSTNPRV